MFLILLSLSQHKASLATSSGSSNGEDCHQNNTVTGNLKYVPIIAKNDTVKLRAVDLSTEVCFTSFLSGGLFTAIVVNPPERKLAECTSVRSTIQFWNFLDKST